MLGTYNNEIKINALKNQGHPWTADQISMSCSPREYKPPKARLPSPSRLRSRKMGATCARAAPVAQEPVAPRLRGWRRPPPWLAGEHVRSETHVCTGEPQVLQLTGGTLGKRKLQLARSTTTWRTQTTSQTQTIFQTRYVYRFHRIAMDSKLFGRWPHFCVFRKVHLKYTSTLLWCFYIKYLHDIVKREFLKCAHQQALKDRYFRSASQIESHNIVSTLMIWLFWIIKRTGGNPVSACFHGSQQVRSIWHLTFKTVDSTVIQQVGREVQLVPGLASCVAKGRRNGVIGVMGAGRL